MSQDGDVKVWAARCTVAAAAITEQTARDCKFSRSALGVFLLTLSNGVGGAANTQRITKVSVDGAAGLTYQVVDTSPTVITINVTAGSNGAAADPTAIRAEVTQYTDLGTPA